MSLNGGLDENSTVQENHILGVLCISPPIKNIYVQWKYVWLYKTISKIQTVDVSRHLFVRQVEQKLPVEAPRPPECWVDRIKSICSTDDHYLPTTVQTVHQGQKSGHNRTKQMKDRWGEFLMKYRHLG